jgi:hypothetical protein
LVSAFETRPELLRGGYTARTSLDKTALPDSLPVASLPPLALAFLVEALDGDGTVNLTGTLKGGTLVLGQGTQMTASSATLDGVTANGNFSVGSGTSSTMVTVKNGLTLKGTANLGSANGSTYGQLSFQGS